MLSQQGTHNLEKRGRDYLQLLNKIKQAESIPYAEALANRKLVADFEGKVRIYNEEIRQLTGKTTPLFRLAIRSPHYHRSKRHAVQRQNASAIRTCVVERCSRSETGPP